MRILHVIDSFSPVCGGPPEAVRQLVKAYQEIEVPIEVVCLDRPDAPYLQDISCPVHALGQSYFGRYAFSPRLWRWLRKNIARYDGIVMNGIWTFPGMAVSLAARRSKTPYGVFVHGALDPWFNRHYPIKHFKKMLYWRVQYDALRRARAVFFTTEQEKRLAGESFRPNRWNGVVVPYGITDPQISEQETGRWVEAFYAKFPLLRGRRYLLFMSRIHEKKGCDLLIEAFAKYAERYPDLDLVIAGPDQVGMRAKLEKRAERLKIAQRIHWPGMISGSLKWGALHACEAMVLPSHQENFGIVVVESLAMGRPVLISNQVNIWSEIEASRVGMVDDDTPEGVERLLGRWTAMSTTERAGMAAGARAAFHKNYAMDRTATLIRDMFLEKDVRG